MNTYGQLLIQAVQDTMETMAFAEVVPVEMFIGKEKHALTGHCPPAPESSSASGWGDDEAIPAPPPVDENAEEDDDWGGEAAASSIFVADWGGGKAAAASDSGGWGDPSLLAPVDESAIPALAPVADFDALTTQQTDWCRACMRVNSPDVHSVWFIVPQGLAQALAENMYSMTETLDANNPILRDLVAEITNVLGGRMMLLLERLGGKFTLTVPEIDFDAPNFPEDEIVRMVTCHVLVDGTYPVISSIVFSGEIKGSIE